MNAFDLFDKLVALGEKKGGTENGKKAKKLIINHINKNYGNGFSIKEEKFELLAVAHSEAHILFGNKKMKVHLYENTGSQGKSVNGELYFAGNNINRRNKHKIKDKIIVFSYSLLYHRILQIGKALKCGAKGVIIVSNNDNCIQNGIGFPYIFDHCKIPAVAVTKSDWQKLKETSCKEVTIDYQNEFGNFQGANVIVDVGKVPTGKTIVIGAHYDSWYSGSHDNCIAVQMLADMLGDILHSKNKFKNNVRLIFFDAEEIGLRGAIHHLDNNDTRNYKYYLNLEMPIPAKYGKLKTFFYSSDKIVKKSFSKLQFLFKGIIPFPFKLYYKILPLFPADIDPFYRKNIPCLTTFCSNKYYHTIMDTKENINFDQYEPYKKMLLEIIKKADNYIYSKEKHIAKTKYGTYNL